MTEPAPDVTELLLAYRDGDREAFGQMLPMVYDDLRRIARRQLGRSIPNQTLDTTSLVHESFLKMVDQKRIDLQDRAHFLAIAARAMRQVIITYARRRGAAKRGAGSIHETLDEGRIAVADQAEQLLALDQALTHLSERDERLVRVVECRFFAGLQEEETAAALGVSLRTVQRDWMRARAWLREELRG
ncbi:MAG: sigma-70 family RNA polymerase sigma factor [Thermoanaerobaculia bacterium]